MISPNLTLYLRIFIKKGELPPQKILYFDQDHLRSADLTVAAITSSMSLSVDLA
jgi:hypothetical protein